MKRYVTYDIKDGNSYDDLYAFFDENKATQITKSTYLVSSNKNFDDFCAAIKKVTSSEDTVAVISSNKNDGTFHRIVR